MSRKSIAMLFGGESSEHEVSISSASNVYNAIDKNKHTVSLIFIDKAGRWWLIDQFEEHESPTVRVSINPGSRVFTTSNGHTLKPDILFPILHGQNGEDGSIQGLAQLIHMPVVGCDMTPSVLAMDKIATKEILAYHGFSVLPFLSHRSSEPMPSYEEVSMQLGSTLFVKPSRAGSSVGVSRVHDKAAFVEAIKAAHEHDEFVLIERAALKPRELEVAILGLPPMHEASGVGEIIPEGEFYSYDSKYALSSGSQVIVPADINRQLEATIRLEALRAYAVLKCRGLARVDFLLDSSGLYFNEINTIPGFTNISMYPKLWQAAGVEYPELIEQLLATAHN